MRALHDVTGPIACRSALAVCLSTLLLAACTKPAPETAAPSIAAVAAPPATSEAENELKWARLALARNPTLEIIAIDTAASVFTVRFKDTGEIRAVKAGDLAAAPVASLVAGARPAPAAEQFAPPPQAASAAPAAPSQAAAPTSQVASSSTTPGYTIERADGQVKVSGPGVSIVSTGMAAVPASANNGSQRGADPIICEGRRMLHFDNRNIYVEGDAIIARGGCELYITNSRVVADGTGVVVRDATVHISNSTIEGGSASFDADDTAKVFVRSSTFQGLPRRSAQAVVQDQGGNQWR